tara:strand:+ start:716 stop:1996 length:1281 start_codon:yes stop_codon:yes gene_type:complete
MEERFYDKSNFEMIYDVLDTDMSRRSGVSLDDLSLNAREVIFKVMNDTFSPTQTLEESNKTVLSKCVPILMSSVPKRMIADGRIEIFKKSIETQPAEIQPLDKFPELKPVDNEIKQEIDSNSKNNEPKQSTMHLDLDVSSSDRRLWTINSDLNNPYKFTVQLGASATFPGISTMNTLKNVTGLVVTHAIIPDTTSNPLEKYPYLYLEIEELSGVYHSTSDHGRKALVKLIRDKQWAESSSSNVRYNLMNTRGTGARPSVGWRVDTPIGTLSKLTIKILTPNGFEIAARQDVFNFSSLDSVSAADTIEITCTNRFEPNAIHAGNRIGFQVINDASGSLVTSEISNTLLKDFLEKNEHTVISVTNDQTFSIASPIESYDGTGAPVYTHFNTNYTGLTNSLIMNYSVQSNFGFNVTSVRHKIEDAPHIV